MGLVSIYFASMSRQPSHNLALIRPQTLLPIALQTNHKTDAVYNVIILIRLLFHRKSIQHGCRNHRPQIQRSQRHSFRSCRRSQRQGPRSGRKGKRHCGGSEGEDVLGISIPRKRTRRCSDAVMSGLVGQHGGEHTEVDGCSQGEHLYYESKHLAKGGSIAFSCKSMQSTSVGYSGAAVQ